MARRTWGSRVSVPAKTPVEVPAAVSNQALGDLAGMVDATALAFQRGEENCWVVVSHSLAPPVAFEGAEPAEGMAERSGEQTLIMVNYLKGLTTMTRVKP